MRILIIFLVAFSLLIGVTAASRTTPAMKAGKETGHVAVIYGLHVALPHNMKSFPAELIPLP
jgi:hypothetical protein